MNDQNKEMNPMQDDDDVVTLLSATGEEIDFVEIAGIAYKGHFYAILQPVELLEGMDDDIIDAVFEEYNKLYEEAHRKEND